MQSSTEIGGDFVKYGAILKACRERAGLNQEELAFRLHVNQSDISKYETNVKEPTLSTVKAWVEQTQTQEVLIAFLCGVDGIGVMQNIMDMVSSFATGFIGGILC